MTVALRLEIHRRFFYTRLYADDSVKQIKKKHLDLVLAGTFVNQLFSKEIHQGILLFYNEYVYVIFLFHSSFNVIKPTAKQLQRLSFNYFMLYSLAAYENVI